MTTETPQSTRKNTVQCEHFHEVPYEAQFFAYRPAFFRPEARLAYWNPEKQVFYELSPSERPGLFQDSSPFRTDLLDVITPPDTRISSSERTRSWYLDLLSNFHYVGITEGHWYRLRADEQRPIFGHPILGRKRWRFFAEDRIRIEALVATPNRDREIITYTEDEIRTAIHQKRPLRKH